jgi:uncharacterized protein (DUF1501 family)
MKRRDFLKKTGTGAVIPAVIGGFSLRSFGEDSPLNTLLANATETDHVLVIVQLNGGNDGLNMVLPKDNFSAYYNARTNIAIPESKILSLNKFDKTGLHPSMRGIQTLFNEGSMGIIQSVGYPQPNFSHFRATDIWMSATDSNQVLTSGWGGRYLNYEYPNFPDGYPNSSMPDPLGIQIGSVTSLTFQGPAVNMGMSISNPTSFYNLLNGVEDPAPNTPAGKELKYVRLVSKQTQKYATVIKNAADKVPSQGVYPTLNPLADQLKIVARLIKGGLKTRLYMVSYGGFDNHSLQVNPADTTTGTHANLLKNVSDAIKAFQDDIRNLGVDERVVGMTFSEFGRRIKSNSSGGTDHGSAAPMILFGKNVMPAVWGNNPALPANATVNDNIPMQYDFRSVYASLLENWLCVKNSDLQTIMLKDFQNIPLVNSATCKNVAPNTGGTNLITNSPNPFTSSTTITFKSEGGHTLIQIMDTLGRVLSTPIDQVYPQPGTYTIPFNSGALPSGVYYARLQNGAIQQVRTMMKVR